MEEDFGRIPVIDFGLAQSPDTKPEFLAKLRYALVRVGFFYLSNHSVPEDVQNSALEQAEAFFRLPEEEKLEMDSARSRHFLGYNSMNAEKTVATTGHNESLFFGPGFPAPGPSQPPYSNLHGPNQWPNPDVNPKFRPAVESYLASVQDLAKSFITLVPEALGLESNSFQRLFEGQPFSRLNFRRYPAPPQGLDEDCRHGIAPHKDSSYMTYLLQGGEHSCLEVQNKSGKWIPVPPIPGTMVVNIGRLLEILTRGVCVATTHRVILGSDGFRDKRGNRLGPRLSIPFFQNVSLPLMPQDFVIEVPPHVASLAVSKPVCSDAGSFFMGIHDNSIGDTVFVSMLTSFVETAEKWYPELLPLALQRQSETKLRDQARGIKIS